MIMKYAQKVKKRYLTILNDMAKNRDSYVKNPEKDFTRKRKLSFQDTINTIVTYDAGSIGRCIKRYIPKVEKTPTTSAFLQQQKKLKLSAFQTLFYRFNDPFPDKTLYNLHILSVDGTGVTVPMDRINENKEYARVRTNKDCTRPAYQFHVSCIYDLINERYCDAYIEPFRTHSETHVFSVMLERKNFPQKALFIADRGYESYLLMAQIQHDGNYFLIRAREDFGQGSMIKGYPFPRDGTFDHTVTYIYTKTQNKRTKANPELYKRVATRNSPYFINKEHPYVKMTLRFVMIVLPNGQKECLITNLPANKFPPETLKKLYCIRWKIETSFRLIKYSANLLEFHSKKIEFLQQEIWAKMIFYNFTTTITQHLRYKRDRGKYQYKPNMTNALQMCKDYLRNAKTPNDVEGHILMEMTPIRDGRSFKRDKSRHQSVFTTFRHN